MVVYTALLIWSIITLVSGTLIFRKKNYIRNSIRGDEMSPVSIIIPARNEEENLPGLLESIKRQKGVDFEVIVADDGSTDNTAELAESYGAAVTGVPKTDDPGKYFACHTGSTHAAHELLLFMDADTFFTDDHSLVRLCAEYSSRKERGVLSVQPFHQTGHRHERLSAVFNLMTVAGINIFSAFTKNQHAGTVFGPVLMTNKKDYDDTGGHMAAKGYIIEGSAIYDSYTKSGLPTHHYLGKGTVHFRMYSEGFKSMIDGWKKHISVGAEHTAGKVMAAIMVWLSSSFVIPALLIYTAVYDLRLMPLSILIYIIGCLQFYNLSRPVIDVRAPESLLYPAYQYFFFFVYTLSLYQVKIKKNVKWKNREIKYEKH